MFWTELMHWLTYWLTYWLTQKHNGGLLCTNRFGLRELLLKIRLSLWLSFNLYFEIKEELEPEDFIVMGDY